MTAAVPDPRFRDQLDQLILEHWRTPTSGCDCGQVCLGQSWSLHLADMLMPTIAAEVEARVQAAEQCGYERGRRDFQFAPEGDNHHNARLCPYCTPDDDARVQAAPNQRAVKFHRAENAEERGEGICRTCLAPIWNEGGTVGRVKRAKGWSDRIERGGDSLVCFKAVDYRHVPLAGREAAIYDRAAALAQPAPGGRP